MSINKLLTAIKGGKGSGNFGHGGRPGKVGGSVATSNSLEQSDFFDAYNASTTFDVIEHAHKQLAARWDVDESDVIQLAAEEGIVPDPGVSYKEAVAYRYIRSWIGSSGGYGETYAIAKVADRLGLKYDLPEKYRNVSKYVQDRPALDRALTSFGNAMYDFTQDWLKQKGVKNLTVMRADSGNKNNLYSSWSLNYAGLRHGSGRKLLKRNIPAKYVLSLPVTGFGNASESEVVVLQGGV